MTTASPEHAAELQRARLHLVRTKLQGEDALTAALARATELAADAMNVERVGVWLLVRGATTITCVEQYTRSTGTHERGEELVCAEFPAYCRALEEARAIVADDARGAAETCELRSYLDRHRITSMLDAPVFRNGDIVGIVCHEHVGPSRHWTESEQGFACSVADVIAHFFETAARLRCEQALHRSEVLALRREKQDSLRVFAGGVAHDINNALVAASASVLQLQRGSLRPADEEAVGTIAQTLAHVGKLARELQGFAAPVPDATDVVELASFLDELAPVLRALVASDVVVTTRSTALGVFVRIDRDALRRVLLNLVRNAGDAMNGGGEIAIGLDASLDRVTLAVRDEGVGMTDEVKRRAFDPFFSTKAGGGRGLGLSTVAAIVRSAGGTIEVDTALGRGTTIRLRLPRVLTP